MSYKLTDAATIVVVRNQDGGVEYHSAAGPEIEWLSPEQETHLTGLGLVKRMEDD